MRRTTIQARSCEDELAAAVKKHTRFLGPANKWHRPRGQTDMSNFADYYTLCWGLPLFSKAARQA